ncbi:MAG: acetyltransferase [Phycisphaerae bacterium]|nr:acetyltransferase [Phycisphaerae bacterium]NUQ46178.1 acetyltransferase [Phycisphaerae bacterium]
MKIVIFGAGGHGRVVLDVVHAQRQHEVAGFLDSDAALKGRRIDGLPVLGGAELLPRLKHDGIAGAIVAIGDNGVRRSLHDAIHKSGLTLVNAVHPSAQIAASARMGRNVVVAAGVVVSAHCQIGDSVILNTGCIVDHESMIGTAAHICPGVRLAGHVTIESGAFVGIGATVIQNIRIGFDAVVGAGAVVIRDVAPMSTVVGMPAREIKCAPSAAQFATLLHPRYDLRDPMHAAVIY